MKPDRKVKNDKSRLLGVPSTVKLQSTEYANHYHFNPLITITSYETTTAKGEYDATDNWLGRNNIKLLTCEPAQESTKQEKRKKGLKTTKKGK